MIAANQQHQSLVELNSQGVRMLELMAVERGINCFSKGLKRVQTGETTSSLTEELREESEVQRMDCEDDPPLCIDIKFHSLPFDSDKPTTRSAYHESSFFMIDQAIAVVPRAPKNEDRLEKSCNHQQLQQETTAMTAVLLYNLGLSFHIKGLMTPDPKLLERALRCYHMAMDVSGLIGLASTNQALELAILNNMASIQALLVMQDIEITLGRIESILGQQSSCDADPLLQLLRMEATLNLMAFRHASAFAPAA